MSIQLIFGLQNSGAAYRYTRHNAGAWFVQAFAQRCGATFQVDKKNHAEMALCEWRGHQVRAFLPLGFMNQSGRTIKSVCQFYKVPPSNILVVHDELDMEPGRLKLKTGGGHGGHNGLRDIIQQLGSNEYHRLRIGIGHPGHKDMVSSYVLGKPGQQDRQLIYDAIDRGLAVMEPILAGNLAIAMNELNR
ncbi:MAG: aminoacyl-tRNA hydrolase [Legionellaceae bacterium]|nr:aminoacyl-tRNA hydrolase [Legionellaceae bacterium]